MRKEESNVSQDTTEDLKAEYIRLQRQFRLLQDDRNTFREETEYLLKKQRETINVLNEEHCELAKDNKLAGGTKVKNVDKENTQMLKNLLEDEKLTKVTFGEKRQKLENVNREIKGLLSTSDVQRQHMGGCKESERKTKEMNKMIMVMENRLNEGNKKFNISLAENNKMRQEIDHIHIQRRKFEDLHKKLTSMFRAKKKEKDYLIETATTLFNTRDEAHNRMQSLREKSERDISQYYAELKDLLRIIDHDKKLHEFMTTKSEERGELYEATVQGRREKKLRDHVKALQGEVENYDEIFSQLVEVSGLDDVNEMVNHFIRVEDENFAAFNYIKEQTQVIQEKEAASAAFNKQIEKISLEETSVDASRQKIQDKLEQQETEALEEYQNLTVCIKGKQTKLDNLAEHVERLFDQINCNRAARNSLLGGSKITHTNMISWIGLIEQRCCELMQAKTLISNKKDSVTEQASEPNILSFNTVGKVIKFLVQPPSLHPDTESSALVETSRPLSQKETRAIAANITKAEKEKRLSEITKKIF